MLPKLPMNVSTESILQVLTHHMMVRRLISPKWLEEMMMTGRCFKMVPSVPLAKGCFS